MVLSNRPATKAEASPTGFPSPAASCVMLLLTTSAAFLTTACSDSPAPREEPEPAALFEEYPLPEVSLECGREDVPTILDSIGGGVALFDADGDGDQDLFLADPGPYPTETEHGGRNRLLRNDGGTFIDVTLESGVDVGGVSNGVAVADFDGDGLRDLYLTRLGKNVLLRNLGDLHFEIVEDAAGAAGNEWSASAAFVDMDLDGDQDLYVANYVGFDPANPPMHGKNGRTCLWREQVVYCGPQGLPSPDDHFYRNENGRFVEATVETGFGVAPGFGLGVLEGDFDRDGRPDLYVSNDSTPNFLFRSNADGLVRESGLLSGAALSANGREQAGMGIAAGDIDNDGDEDLFVTNFSNDENSLYVSEGDGWFRDEASRSGLGATSRALLGWGCALVDVDLDGDLDVVVLNGHVYPQADARGTDTSYAQPDRLWLNDGAGRFTAQSWVGDTPSVSRSLAVGDVDDDGVPDLVVIPLRGQPVIWRGVADPKRSLKVRVVGPPGNPDAYGTEITLVDGKGTQFRRVRASGGFQASHDPRPIFAFRGEGQLKVRFPDGSEKMISVTEPGMVVVQMGDS